MVELYDFPHQGPTDLFWVEELPQQEPIGNVAFSTSYPELDEILLFYPGQFVVVTGVPGSGKSTLLLNILCRIAREDGRKSFLYVPENEGFLRDKLHALWDIPQPAAERGFNFYMGTHFVCLSSRFTDQHRTLKWILSRVEWAVNELGVSMVLVDPWNEIERTKPKDMALTDYIGECIGAIKDSCRAFGYTFIMVAHPTKAVNENGGRTPALYDIEGSANWANKCDNGLIVVRDGNSCRVISAKTRELGAGKSPGQCWFNVDPRTGRFTAV